MSNKKLRMLAVVISLPGSVWADDSGSGSKPATTESPNPPITAGPSVKPDPVPKENGGLPEGEIRVPCLDASGRVMDWHECADVEAHLQELVRIAEAKKKLKDLETGTSVNGAAPVSPMPQQLNLPPASETRMPGRAEDVVRVSGLFGETASILWKGRAMTVRAGSRLPGGALIEKVASDGVEIRHPGGKIQKVGFVGASELE